MNSRAGNSLPEISLVDRVELSNNVRSVHEICTYTRSSMVMPACASTSFSLSSKILISLQSCPALSRFSIQPDPPCQIQRVSRKNRVAERRLHALPGNLMACREACGVGCESVPCTAVKIPAATRNGQYELQLCVHWKTPFYCGRGLDGALQWHKV